MPDSDKPDDQAPATPTLIGHNNPPSPIIADWFLERNSPGELGMAQRTLAKYRADGTGPAWMRSGGKVWIHRESARRWMEQRTVQPVRPSQPGLYPSQARLTAPKRPRGRPRKHPLPQAAE